MSASSSMSSAAATSSAASHSITVPSNLKVCSVIYVNSPTWALWFYLSFLDCWSRSCVNEWLAHRVELRIQEEGAASLAGGWRAGRGGRIPQVCEWHGRFSVFLDLISSNQSPYGG